MTRFAAFCVCLTATVGVLAACSNETITIATAPDDTESSSEAGVKIQVGGKCTQNSDCPDPNMFCEKNTCDDVSGTCHFPPAGCPDDIEDPTCGCDGVTYFNDCMRKAAGVPAADDGECNHGAATCNSDGIGCTPNSGQFCARLQTRGNPSTCTAMDGRCWVVPSQCPATAHDPDGDQNGFRWDECSTDVGAAHCLNTCTAIHMNKAFIRAYELCQ